MVNRLTAAAIVLAAAVCAGAAGDSWKYSLNANATLASNIYSDSWAGGEASSAAWVSNIIAGAAKQLNPKMNWATNLKLSFGQTFLQDKTTRKWSEPAKSADRIDFETVLTFTLGGWGDPFISGRLISQFLDMRDSVNYHYVNPAEVTEAAGVSRKFVDNDVVNWQARLGGALRQVVDRYTPAADGSVVQDVTNDGGVELMTEFKAQNKDKWAQFTSMLKIYEAIFSSTAKRVVKTLDENDWRYPHVNWENVLTVTVAKYIMLNATVQLLYDKEIHENARFKEVFGLGLTYTYPSK